MRITEIGAGTIGVSWTVLLAAAGHDVVVTDPRPDLADVVETEVARFGSPDLLDRVVCEPDLAVAVAGADVVQEQGPEDLAVKREIWATVAAHAPTGALLLSSTSGILPSDIAAELPDDAAARLLVAHPFNPPHVLPLVELVAGRRTGRDAVERAAAFLRGVGKDPVEIHKEVYGFVGNRLQSALFAKPCPWSATAWSPPPSSTGWSPGRSARAGRPAGRSCPSTSAAVTAACATCSSTSARAWRAAGPTWGTPPSTPTPSRRSAAPPRTPTAPAARR